MDDDLRKILGESGEEPVTTPPAEVKVEPKVEPEPTAEEQEVKAKAEQLANLNKAIAEAQGVLKKSRKEIKAAKTPEEEDEELPKINLEDPSAKAWDKRIRDNSAPLQAEIEQAKSERRNFALRQFLGEHPALAKDQEKLKSLMGTYEKLRTASELTTEGILLDLDKAYAAEHSDELLSATRQARIDASRNDEAFSEIAVSRGATSYSSPKSTATHLSEEDRDIIKGWERSGAPKI